MLPPSFKRCLQWQPQWHIEKHSNCEKFWLGDGRTVSWTKRNQMDRQDIGMKDSEYKECYQPGYMCRGEIWVLRECHMQIHNPEMAKNVCVSKTSLRNHFFPGLIIWNTIPKGIRQEEEGRYQVVESQKASCKDLHRGLKISVSYNHPLSRAWVRS